MEEKLFFLSDYMEGTHPDILQALCDTNMRKSAGYGLDPICDAARDKIRTACGCPEGEVWFLTGGKQTNATVIDACLHSWQGVIAAETGHISTHEAGAIELGGHKVLTLPHRLGKLSAEAIRRYTETFFADDNHAHMVAPGMVYLSQPTEYGTLYSKAELQAISDVCRAYGLKLYVDGARLAYALSCPENDVTLPDLARLCDVFYIGGTKCGALLGEAVVIPSKGLLPHFFTVIKQHGALLAKGRVLGIQFDRLFTDGLYFRIGQSAITFANQIRQALREKGYELAFSSPTNQIFVILNQNELKRLTQAAELGFWEKYDDERTVMRIATSWATTQEDVTRLIEIL